MADTSSSDSSLIWLWVIEYLASFPQIDASILQELIETAPDLPEDLGKNTREMVSLRCLEDLFEPSKGLTDDVPFAPDQKVTFDFSESCEDVLQSILQETSLSDLKMAGPALLKWDVHPFIMHKRASMPKCALEQLKDAILEGTHPCATSLKELSGLVHTSDKVYKDARIPADCGDLNSLTCRINGSITDAQIMAPEGNPISLPIEHENREVGDDSHKRNLLPFKRDRSNLPIKSLAGDYHGNQGCTDDGDDLNSNAKRFKKNASCTNLSVEQIVIPPPGKEMEEDSSIRMVGDTEKGDFRVEKESEVGGSQGRISLENDHDECAATNMLRQSDDVDGMDEQILIPLPGKEVEEDSSKRVVGDTGKGDFQAEKASEMGGSEERSLENDHDECAATNMLRQSDHVDGVDEQILIPLLGKEVEEDSSKRMAGDTGKRDFQVEKESEMGGLEERSLENDHDKCVATNMLRQSHDVDAIDEFWHNLYQTAQTAHDANKVLQDTSRDRPQQHILVDEANDAEPRLSSGAPSGRAYQLKQPYTACLNESYREINDDEAEGCMEHACEEDRSSDSDEHAYDHERVDVTMKKNNFLSSQCTSFNFPETVDWTEQKLCVKCSKDGQLLVCRAVGCPLVVHENCLSSSARFDERGNFYCPFCAYSLDISEYLKAKRQTSLSKKEFDAFIDMGLEHQPKKHSKRLHSKRNSHSGKNEDDDRFHETHDNVNLVEGGCHQANKEDHMCEEKGNEPLVEPLASCIGVSLLDREEELDANGGKINISSAENKREEMVQDYPSVRGFDGQQDQVYANLKCNGDKILCKDKELVSVTQAVGGMQKEVLECTDSLEKPICTINIDEGETYDREDVKSIIPSYSMRSRRQEVQYTFPGSPRLRRNKVPWTAQEEEALKEGVQKFASATDRNIPWKKILDHGSSIFFNSRTAIDLKDKWRNMCKRSSKS